MKYGQTTVRQDMLGIGGNRQDTGNRQETRTPGLNFRLAKKQGPGKTRSANVKEKRAHLGLIDGASVEGALFFLQGGYVCS